VLSQACYEFISESESVHYLSRSLSEPLELYNSACKQYGKQFVLFNRSVADRNWNWKAPDFDYSRTRAEDKPGYVGSYCMDALAMALHTVWKSSSFKEVALVNANLGGDCDTVGAIAGQIAGAMYGIDKGMLQLYS
jgi:ADP-ribosylglycohydrolase